VERNGQKPGVEDYRAAMDLAYGIPITAEYKRFIYWYFVGILCASISATIVCAVATLL